MNLTSQSLRIVDNDSELISIYLHNAESKREYFLTPYSVLRWEYKIRWLTEINSIHLIYDRTSWKKRDPADSFY